MRLVYNFFMFKHIFTYSSVFFIFSCAVRPVQENPKVTPSTSQSWSAETNQWQAIQKDTLSKMIREDEVAINEDAPSENELIAKEKIEARVVPLPLQRSFEELKTHPRVKKWIDYFGRNESDRFQRFLTRGQKYKTVVEDILEQNGLPKELYYLAMIESGYANHATSHASAVGTWQFIKGTGKNYGLLINSEVDERRDPIRATEAASRYLMELYHGFESWELALAAYNCGEHRVLRALMKNKDRDYWSLIEKGALPAETIDYVPKFIAAIIVGNNPEEYGLKTPGEEVVEFPQVELKSVPAGVGLGVLASKANVSLDLLSLINPHLLRGKTPSLIGSYEIWVPKGEVSDESIAALKTQGVSPKEVRSPAKVAHKKTSRSYVVKKGDSLILIAKKLRTTAEFLIRENRLKSSAVFPGQVLMTQATHYEPKKGRFAKTYRVKQGDTLVAIARRFGVSQDQLKKRNRLRGTSVRAGQLLTINK